MLIAAGWEFPVSEELIRRVDAGAGSRFAETARRCVSPRPPEQRAAVIADFESREDDAMAQHLRAIRDHQPWIDTQAPQPTTLVLRGGLDRSVSLRDHVELAERTGGALIPVGSAAHMPFVDHGEEVVRWLNDCKRSCSPDEPADEPFSLEGKVVLITGASRGIGQAIAVEAAEAGAEGIVLAARGVEP